MSTLARLNILVGADISDLERKLAKATRSIQVTSRSVAQVGQKLTAAVTLPLVGIGAAAIKMASDAEEAASKFQAVFGDAAGEVNGWLQVLRRTVPATTAELQAMTAEIQDLIVPLGLAPDKAEDMTKQVVRLAADLASFNNIPMAEALDRIRAGLVGSNEPLLKFGVALNAAMVESRALAMGLIEQGQAITPAARAQAAFALILERTTAAQGDAARTANSTANEFKFFVAETKELGAIIGQRLLPVITPMVSRLTDVLRGVTNLSPEVKQLGINTALFFAVLGPGLAALARVSAIIAALTPPIIISVAAVAGAIVVWRTWTEEVKAFFGAIGKAFGFIKRIAELINPIAARSTEATTKAVGDMLSTVRSETSNLVGEVKGAFADVGAAAAAAGAAINTQFTIPVVNAATAVRDQLTPAQQKMLEQLDNIVPKLAAMNAALGQVPVLVREVTAVVQESEDKVRDFGEQLHDLGVASFGNFTNAVADFATGSKDAFKDFVNSAIRDLARLTARFLAFKALTALFPGSDFVSAVGKSFGFLASGGPARAGQPYIVGERGPELFVPDVSGSVVPNGAAPTLRFDSSSLPPLQRPQTPHEAARDDWWRQFVQTAMIDWQDRGGRLRSA